MNFRNFSLLRQFYDWLTIKRLVLRPKRTNVIKKKLKPQIPLHSSFNDELFMLFDLTEEICDTRNTTKGECCAFPFTYEGETYYECTTKDFNGKQWCSLNEDFEKHRRWGHCGKTEVVS